MGRRWRRWRVATGRTAGGCQEKTIDSLAILANSVLYILYIYARRACACVHVKATVSLSGGHA